MCFNASVGLIDVQTRAMRALYSDVSFNASVGLIDVQTNAFIQLVRAGSYVSMPQSA